jgi:hypothetical protein
LKLLEENIGETLHNTGICNNFLYRTPIAQEIKSKNRQTGLHQNQNFCREKETMTRVKRQPAEGRKSLPAIHSKED